MENNRKSIRIHGSGRQTGLALLQRLLRVVILMHRLVLLRLHFDTSEGRARKILLRTGNYAVFSHFASFFTPNVIVRFPGKVQQGIRDSMKKS